jgi:hypothetical protein
VMAIAARVYKPFDPAFAGHLCAPRNRRGHGSKSTRISNFRNPGAVSTGEYGDANAATSASGQPPSWLGPPTAKNTTILRQSRRFSEVHSRHRTAILVRRRQHGALDVRIVRLGRPQDDVRYSPMALRQIMRCSCWWPMRCNPILGMSKRLSTICTICWAGTRFRFRS